MLSIIFTNIYIFFLVIIAQKTTPLIHYLQIFVLTMYFLEIFIKLTSYGLRKFVAMPWNVFDVFLLVLYWQYVVIKQITFDFTPIKVLKSVMLLSTAFQNFSVLMNSILKSFDHLKSAFSIILITGMLFALAGMHLQSGLFHYRCLEPSSGISLENANCGYSY